MSMKPSAYLGAAFAMLLLGAAGPIIVAPGVSAVAVDGTANADIDMQGTFDHVNVDDVNFHSGGYVRDNGANKVVIGGISGTTMVGPVSIGSASGLGVTNDITIGGEHHRYGYGGMNPDSTQVVGIAAAGQNVWVEVDGCTSGLLDGFTQSACDWTSTYSGVYNAAFGVSFVGGNGKDYEIGISVNDTMVTTPGCIKERTMGTAATVGDFSVASCGIALSASDVVKIEMRGTDGTTVDATVHATSFGITKL